MESPILRQISKFLQDKKRYKRWLAVFVCLAVVVGFATTAALKMRGKAMTHDERVLACKLQVHQHTEACYDQEKNIICGYADFVIHKHNDDCYDPNNGNLACTLPEVEAHQHTEECYQAQEALACGLEESEGHRHTEGCYTKEQGDLACQVEEHAHTEECQGEDGAFTCGKEEHAHTEECYEWKETLTCGQEESEGHKHTPECSQVQKTLVCQKPEVVAHTHGDGCYQRVLITPEGEEIVQDPKDNAGVAQEVLAGTANKEVPEGRIEVRRTCGMLQIEEHTHTEEAGCIEIHEVLDGTDLKPVEEPDENPEAGVTPEDGKEALKNVQTPMDGTEEEETIVKTFEGNEFTVTAEYKKEANIPKEAVLVAEQVTAETDGEHYAEREAEFKKNLGDKNATMNALLKVGFYVDGKEIEPEGPVELTVRLLGEDGLPEGEPITIVHFAEDGTKRIDGSKAESNSTTFEMEGFSEIAIGHGINSVKVGLSESLVYETDNLHIEFQLGGLCSVTIDGNGKTPEAGMHKDGEPKEQTPNGSGEDLQETADDKTEGIQEAPVDKAGTEDALEAKTEGKSPENKVEVGDVSQGNTEEEIERPEDGADTEEVPEETIEDEAGAEDDVAENPDAGREAFVSIENDALEENLEFKVKSLGRNSKKYAAAAAVYAEDGSGEGELFLLQVFSYSLTYNNVKLDMSDCTVTANITPVGETLNQINGSEDAAGEGEESSALLAMIGFPEKNSVGEVIDVETLEADKTVSFDLNPAGTEDTVGFSGTSQANPKFRVQYYAEIDRIVDIAKDKQTKTNVELIDTSGKILPQNGNKDLATKNIYLPTEDGGKVVSEKVWTEVYDEKEYEYIKAPSLTYFNTLAENGNYRLDSIWVLNKNGKEENDSDWTKYPSSIHFTNKLETSQKYPGQFLLIEDGTVVRLRYQITNDSPVNDTEFYDYDISDGKIYGSSSIENGKPNGNIIKRGTATTHNSGSDWYMYTGKQGINSARQDQVFGFGNAESSAKTGMGGNTWNEQTLNMANAKNYKNCTFGLATGLKNNGTIQYAEGVNAPNLFNDGNANGKSTYKGKLTFGRRGDTYTLEGASIGSDSLTGLDSFNYHMNWNGKLKVYSNYFWPMDNVASAGTEGHDLKFATTKTDPLKTFDANGNKLTVNKSDDGKNHNHYFGMYYTVDFDLTEDYVGPLEYVFYGDDDMWVFLSDVNEDDTITGGQLVCDIGGVHSAVGEYVNLWDYIEKGTNRKHRLSFFFTERGASGSCCWMQFTLPSVSFKTPQQSTGSLRVDKEVVGKDEGYEFGFNVEFTDGNGNNLMNDYSYTRYDAEGNSIKSDILIWDGRNFQLKAGEYVVINYLPIGAHYKITEIGPVEYDEESDTYVPIKGKDPYNSSAKGDGVINEAADANATDKRVAKGEIGKVTEYTVKYVNSYKYELPKTGGFGTTLYTMAGAISLLFGAGFLYRKKFREGRVGGSS